MTVMISRWAAGWGDEGEAREAICSLFCLRIESYLLAYGRPHLARILESQSSSNVQGLNGYDQFQIRHIRASASSYLGDSQGARTYRQKQEGVLFQPTRSQNT